MNNIIYGQYDIKNYPLKNFKYDEIPDNIKRIIIELSNKELAIFRGGLSFIYLLNQKKYILKDMDMLALDINFNEILDCILTADVIFINKNSFNKNVITAFWKENNNNYYYKLDILLCEQLPEFHKILFDSTYLLTVTISYLWRNRLEKIAEKEIRNHNDNKVLNNYNVSLVISNYLKENKIEIFETDKEIVKNKLSDIEKVLINFLNEEGLCNFIKLQKYLLGVN